MSNTPRAIETVCDNIKRLLLRKNQKYGDSAINPSRIFSNANPTEQLLVRIDDKLSRIGKCGFNGDGDEDTLDDLIGYLILLKVALGATPTNKTGVHGLPEATFSRGDK